MPLPGTARVLPGRDPAVRDRHSLWWAMAVGALMMALGFLAVSYTYTDPDLWGHLRYGQDLLRTGELYRADAYSYLSGEQPWINHEWLAELAFAAAYGLAGSQGLIALKTAAGLLIVGLTYGHLLRRGATPGFSAALTLLSLALLAPGLWTVRPHAFTYLCTLLLLLILAAAERGRIRWLWVLAPLFALWTNLHGGFLAGVGLLLLWSLLHLGLRLLRRRARVAVTRHSALAGLAVTAGLLATLANPYGLRLWSFLLRTATVPRPEITEWRPLRLASFEGGLYLALVTLSWLGVAASRRPRRPALLALLGLLSLLPLVAYRHTMLFAVAVPVLAGEHIAGLWQRHRPQRRARPPGARARRLEPWLAGLSCLAAAAVLAVWWPKVSIIGLTGAGAGYPVRAVALLRESGAAGNLAVDFDWGEYALWHLGPRVKVSVDGRRETVYAERVYRQNLDLMFGTNDWDAVLDEYDTDLALVSKARPAYNLMSLTPSWVLVYEDPLCGLFAWDGSPLAALLLATPPPNVPYDGEGLAFP